MGIFSSLNREQKESIGLLQLGTFLEYFDFMLYIHMCVLLNELFFPKTDPHTASLLTALALCSGMIFRPVGALIFGWIGDHIGRKRTIVITTSTMAISCFVMANLPTYAQIGIAAAWIVTACRILQGISSLGEIMGAQIYLTETIDLPVRHPAVALVDAFATAGGVFALGIAFLATSWAFNWRIAFWLGASIAIVGAFARIRLRETPVFLEIKREKMKKEIEGMNVEVDPVHGTRFNKLWKESINRKTLASYFFISAGLPLCFYLAYVYFNPILKESFGYSSADVIRHNFFLALLDGASCFVCVYLSYYFPPLKINKFRAFLVLPVMLFMPYLIENFSSPMQVFFVQAMLVVFPLRDMPAASIFMHHMPFYLRFTFASLLFAVSRSLVYVFTSFGLIYLSGYFGVFGLWAITLPVTFAFFYGISHFEKLEKGLVLEPQKTSAVPVL